MEVDREDDSDGDGGGDDEESMPVYIIVPVSNNSLSFRLLRESDHHVQTGRADSTTGDNSSQSLPGSSRSASYDDTPSSSTLVSENLSLHHSNCPFVRWCRVSEMLMNDDDLRKELINSSRQDLMARNEGEFISLFEVRIEPNQRAAERQGPGAVRHYVDHERNMLSNNRNEAARQCKCPRAQLVQDPTISSTSPETEPIDSDEEDLDDELDE